MNPQVILALAQSGTETTDWSAFADEPWLLLEYEPDMSNAEQAICGAFLQRIAAPVIAIAPADADGILLESCDARAVDADAAQPMLETIAQCPQAATVFVQLLRATEDMPLQAALDMESLAFSTLQSGLEYQRWLAGNRADAPFKPSDSGPAVIVERDGSEVQLILNRASNDNAMSVEMRDALLDELRPLVHDESAKKIHLRGNGRCFSTGGDLTEFGTAADPASAHIVRTLTVPGRLLALCAERASVFVHGACVGSGIEFPAFASHIAAASNAYFLLPEISMGLIPGAGGCISIARRMGRQRTAWLGLSGQRIGADTAKVWGLIDELQLGTH